VSGASELSPTGVVDTKVVADERNGVVLGRRISLAARMAAVNGHARGFDYMRLALATSVLAFHSFVTTHDLAADHALWRSSWSAVLRLFLPMFFALSGFLVAGSLARSTTLREFLVLRAMRIVPALLAEVALSALILGPLLSEFTPARYFHDRQFFTYFLNVIGDVHFSLPGLFLHNPRPHLVNGSLWTIPFEGVCYASLALLALAGVVRRRSHFLLAVAIAFTVLGARSAWLHDIVWTLPGPFLVMCFLVGVTFYLYRDAVAYDFRLFAVSLIASLLLLPLDRLAYLAIVPLTYATIYLGLANPQKTVLINGDYSYGIYLFAYPIQQALVLLAPAWRATWIVFLVALPASFAYAAFSWHFVEHPVLRRKKAVVAALGHRA
jgi:peptidoglycan/LPS O-acetylase OafA/YrhL